MNFFSSFEVETSFIIIATILFRSFDSSGAIVKQENLKNVAHNFVQYFKSIPGEHKTTVESTMTWNNYN